MKIKTISRTVSFGNYENMSMTAELEDGEDITSSVMKLEQAISEQIKILKNYESGYSQYLSKKYDYDNLLSEVQDLEKRKADIEAWAIKHNVTLRAVGELPF